MIISLVAALAIAAIAITFLPGEINNFNFGDNEVSGSGKIATFFFAFLPTFLILFWALNHARKTEVTEKVVLKEIELKDKKYTDERNDIKLKENNTKRLDSETKKVEDCYKLIYGYLLSEIYTDWNIQLKSTKIGSWSINSMRLARLYSLCFKDHDHLLFSDFVEEEKRFREDLNELINLLIKDISSFSKKQDTTESSKSIHTHIDDVLIPRLKKKIFNPISEYGDD